MQRFDNYCNVLDCWPFRFAYRIYNARFFCNYQQPVSLVYSGCNVVDM